MGDVLLPPNADDLIGPFAPFPASPTTHFDKVDENPHDSGTTVLRGTTTGIERFGWDVSGIPYYPPQGRLLIRWTAKGGGGNPTLYTARVGLYIGGSYYWAPTRTLVQGSFGTNNETFAVDPSDGGAWTRTKLEAARLALELVSIDFSLPFCEFTQLVGLIAEVADPLARSAASASALGPETSSSEQAKVAAAASVGPGSLKVSASSLSVRSSAARLVSSDGEGG